MVTKSLTRILNALVLENVTKFPFFSLWQSLAILWCMYSPWDFWTSFLHRRESLIVLMLISSWNLTKSFPNCWEYQPNSEISEEPKKKADQVAAIVWNEVCRETRVSSGRTFSSALLFLSDGETYEAKCKLISVFGSLLILLKITLKHM